MMCCKGKWVGGLAALAVLLVGLGVLSGTDAGRWLTGTAWVQVGKVWDWGTKQVSLEDELKRIENEVQNLNKDIADQYDKNATFQAGIEKVEKDVVVRHKAVEEQWRVIKVLQTAIEDAKVRELKTVSFEGKTSDLGLARKELTDRWDAFKRAKAALDQKEAELKEKKATLDAMNENMAAMIQAKDDYKLKLDELQTKLAAAQAAQARAEMQGKAVDETWKSRQAHIQDSMEKVAGQIDVMTKKAQEYGKLLTDRKADTGAGQAVHNDIADEEIRKYEDGLNKLTTSK